MPGIRPKTLLVFSEYFLLVKATKAGKEELKTALGSDGPGYLVSP